MWMMVLVLREHRVTCELLYIHPGTGTDETEDIIMAKDERPGQNTIPVLHLMMILAAEKKV